MTTSFQEKHIAFIGRWSPMHLGHVAMIEKVHQQYPDHHVLILVKDTDYDEFTTDERVMFVQKWLETKGISGKVMIVPEITGIYYGRNVGYQVASVEVDKKIKDISATEIRRQIHQGISTWKTLIACPEVADLIEKVLKERECLC